jgi:hypothetical protein
VDILLVAILLMAIGGYFVIGYWWLLMVIVLMAIGEYSIMDTSGY